MESELGSQRRPPPALTSRVFEHPFIASALFLCFSLSWPPFVAPVVVVSALFFALCRWQTDVRAQASRDSKNRSKPEMGIEEDNETRNGYQSDQKKKRGFLPEDLDNVSNSLSLPEPTLTLLDSDAKEWSDTSISDDDNLIEIILPGGYYVEDRIWENDFPSARVHWFQKRDFPVLESPGTLFSRKAFPEFPSELIEEDDLIEIDISMGSIKYPTVGTKT